MLSNVVKYINQIMLQFQIFHDDFCFTNDKYLGKKNNKEDFPLRVHL